jgi:hypothetical protein
MVTRLTNREDDMTDTSDLIRRLAYATDAMAVL